METYNGHNELLEIHKTLGKDLTNNYREAYQKAEQIIKESLNSLEKIHDGALSRTFTTLDRIQKENEDRAKPFYVRIFNKLKTNTN